jgi:SnoaL-like protein
MTQPEERVPPPAQIVRDLYEAIRDNRIKDMLALVHPDVTCRPLVRPGLTVYHGHDGIVRLASDMHATHGHYQIKITRITEQPGPQLTVQAWIIPEPGRGTQLPVTSVYTLRDGLITTIESFP